MKRDRIQNHGFRQDFFSAAAVALLWLSGLTEGIRFCQESQLIFSPVMRSMVISSAVSIVPFFSSIYLPLVLSYTAIQFQWFYLLFAVVFLKACSLGIVSSCFLQCFHGFGQAGLFDYMFCDLAMAPILLLYWLRTFLSAHRCEFLRFAVFFVLISLIGGLYYCKTMPGIGCF